MSDSLIVRGNRVIRPESSGPAAIYVRDGVISSIQDFDSIHGDAEVLDAGDAVVMPGIVDTHVHLNEPGRAHWEGFESGSRAAAAGGITTLIDMPLNSIPATTTVDALRRKIDASTDHSWVDVGFWGGVVPGNEDSLVALVANGVFGFKCFLVPSGVDEFQHVTENDLRKALPIIARYRSRLLVHAELPGPIDAALSAGTSAQDARRYSSYLASRPRAAENEAIDLLIRLSREYGARIHVVHLSSADAIPAIARARAERVPVTVETCPHYLFFAAEDIPDGATQFKCAPPIRERENRERLWEALSRGDIDFITTDHSPCPGEMKRTDTGDFFGAWGGITSLQFMLSAIWTEARRRGFTLERVVYWLSTAPARIAGLDHKKGSIAAGRDADLVFFRPEQNVDWPRASYHRHRLTPYEGRAMVGVVERTIVRGKTVYARGEFSAASGITLRAALGLLNTISLDEARAAFLTCCGSSKWADDMVRRRPYATVGELLDEADRFWRDLKPEDWLEAFRAHPQIGESSTSQWSEQEQAGARSASDEVRKHLADYNRRYYERFGFIFIVCASGRSAEEMLVALRARLNNSPEDELGNAAEQQRQITRLRLLKLVAS